MEKFKRLWCEASADCSGDMLFNSHVGHYQIVLWLGECSHSVLDFQLHEQCSFESLENLGGVDTSSEGAADLHWQLSGHSGSAPEMHFSKSRTFIIITNTFKR